MIKWLRRTICRWLGHSFRPIDVVLFNIKTNALNRDYDAELKCRMCGQVFELMDKERLKREGPR